MPLKEHETRDLGMKEPAAPLLPRRASVSPAVKEHLQVYVPLIGIIIALAAVANSRNSAFLTGANIERVLLASAVLGILAIGQTFLLVSGQMDLSVGSMVSLGSVVAAKMALAGKPDAWTVLAVVGVAAATGLIWGLVVCYLKVPPFILTLGGLAAVASIALTLAESTPVPVPAGLDWLQTGTLFGIRTPIVIWLGCCLVGGLVLHFTRFGRNVFSIGANEEAAFLSGVATTRVKLAVYVINGALTGLAALIMTGRLGAGDPRAGMGLELMVIAAIVLGGASLGGGRGSVLGSILGVLVLGVVTSALTFLSVPDSYDQLVFGGILIAATCVTAATDLRRRRVRKK